MFWSSTYPKQARFINLGHIIWITRTSRAKLHYLSNQRNKCQWIELLVSFILYIQFLLCLKWRTVSLSPLPPSLWKVSSCKHHSRAFRWILSRHIVSSHGVPSCVSSRSSYRTYGVWLFDDYTGSCIPYCRITGALRSVMASGLALGWALKISYTYNCLVELVNHLLTYR